jgi:hypothetical protein
MIFYSLTGWLLFNLAFAVAMYFRPRRRSFTGRGIEFLSLPRMTNRSVGHGHWRASYRINPQRRYQA